MGVLKTMSETVGTAADFTVYAGIADGVDCGFAFRVGAGAFEEATGLGLVGCRRGCFFRSCA